MISCTGSIGFANGLVKAITSGGLPWLTGGFLAPPERHVRAFFRTRVEPAGAVRRCGVSAPTLVLLNALGALLLFGAAGRAWAHGGGGGGGGGGATHRTTIDGAWPVHRAGECLPSQVALVDQHGNKPSLSSFDGHLVLAHFIDTQCGQRCAPLTEKLVRIGDELGDDLGRTIFFVSISTDPKHDDSQRLLKFAQINGAERPGWLFLTGTPPQVDRALKPFGLEETGDHSHWHSQAIREARTAYLLDRRGCATRNYDLDVVRPHSLAYSLFRMLPWGDTE